jgi:hypothetical protein
MSESDPALRREVLSCSFGAFEPCKYLALMLESPSSHYGKMLFGLISVSQNPLDYLFTFCTYDRLRAKEAFMDNRLNKIRKEMSALRADMLRAEDVIRDQVNHDRHCTDMARRVLEIRARMTAMVAEWKLLGGYVQLPTVEERLKERRGVPARRPRYARPPMMQKRRRVAKS